MAYRSASWRPPGAPLPGRVPRHLKPWIREPGSLTRRLRRRVGDEFAFRRLGEAWLRPARDEARCLAIPRDRYAWTREVWLGVGQTPQIFARTVVPAALLRGRLSGLKHLGDRPLGDLIFGRRRLVRGQLTVALLHPGDWLHDRALAATPACLPRKLWARRSVFHVDTGSLLVTEVFLAPWLLTEATA